MPSGPNLLSTGGLGSFTRGLLARLSRARIGGFRPVLDPVLHVLCNGNHLPNHGLRIGAAVKERVHRQRDDGDEEDQPHLGFSLELDALQRTDLAGSSTDAAHARPGQPPFHAIAEISQILCSGDEAKRAVSALNTNYAG